MAKRDIERALRKKGITAEHIEWVQAVDVGAAEAVLDALDKAAESEWGRHIAWHGFRDEEARISVVRQALAAITPAKSYVCTGCGRTATDPEADLLAIQQAGAMTCCPERRVVEQPTRALGNAQAEGWISVKDRLPERNKPAIYWHKSDFGGFPAIADEWRDEHHLRYTSHWMPYTPPQPEE